MLPIWAAVNEAVKAGKVQPLPDQVGRLGLHLSIRLNILPRVVRKVNTGTFRLFETTREYAPEYVFTEANEGYAFPVDDDLKYSLLADIDALLFELNSACELMTRLFGLLRDHVGQPVPQKQLGSAISEVLGRDAGWFISLDKHRNFFMHEGAPYLAVDLSNSPTALDLLIMKDNVPTFTDPDTFVPLSEVNTIVQGFVAAKHRLQKYLISLFK